MGPPGHGERLSAIDASFLALETPRAHMHVGWSSLLSPAPGGERPTIEALRARAVGRLHWVPRCRQRLHDPPLGIGEPYWIDDPAFDIANHVVALSDPGDAVEPDRFVALRDAVLSEPLDRRRPLWQIALVPRLHDGRAAIVARVHHAMADGTAALQVALLALDTGGDADADVSPTPWTAAQPPGPAQRALDPALHAAQLASRAARDVVRVAARPRARGGVALRGARLLARAVAADLLPLAPASGLNPDLGPRRTLSGYRTPIAELRAAARAAQATLNDVGLTVVAGALRALARERGEPVVDLKAMIPVDVRRADERATLGNRVSATSVWLPLELASPRARLERVREQTRAFKRDERADGTATLLGAAELLPRPVREAFARAGASRKAFNLTISNVPGPREALSVMGATMDELYPVIPLADEHALSIGMFSYQRHLHFGVYADPDALPGVTRLPDLLAAEVRALRAVAGAPRPRGPAAGLVPATAGPAGRTSYAIQGDRR